MAQKGVSVSCHGQHADACPIEIIAPKGIFHGFRHIVPCLAFSRIHTHCQENASCGQHLIYLSHTLSKSKIAGVIRIIHANVRKSDVIL